MRFWKEFIGLLSLGKVVGQAELTRETIIKESTDAFKNYQANVDVKWSCIFEMFFEGLTSGTINIEDSSKDYLPACFEVFSTKNKLGNSASSVYQEAWHKQIAMHWESQSDSVETKGDLRIDIDVLMEFPLIYHSEIWPSSHPSLHFLYDKTETSLPLSNDTCDATDLNLNNINNFKK